MRERLNSQLGDLEQRAKNAQLQKSDVIAFRERIVDSRLQHALDNLDERAKAKGIERQDFERIKALMDQRAELVKAEGNAEEMAFEQTLRDKLGTSIDGLEKRGFDTIEPKDIMSIREALADRRLDRELSSLERNSMSKRATDGDIQALRDAIADRGEMAGVAAPDAGSVQGALSRGTRGHEGESEVGPDHSRGVRNPPRAADAEGPRSLRRQEVAAPTNVGGELDSPPMLTRLNRPGSPLRLRVAQRWRRARSPSTTPSVGSVSFWISVAPSGPVRFGLLAPSRSSGPARSEKKV
jgi:hypothetical protein